MAWRGAALVQSWCGPWARRRAGIVGRGASIAEGGFGGGCVCMCVIIYLYSTVRRQDYAKGRRRRRTVSLLRRDLCLPRGRCAAVGRPARALPLHPPPQTTVPGALGHQQTRGAREACG